MREQCLLCGSTETEYRNEELMDAYYGPLMYADIYCAECGDYMDSFDTGTYYSDVDKLSIRDKIGYWFRSKNKREIRRRKRKKCIRELVDVASNLKCDLLFGDGRDIMDKSSNQIESIVERLRRL